MQNFTIQYYSYQVDWLDISRSKEMILIDVSQYCFHYDTALQKRTVPPNEADIVLASYDNINERTVPPDEADIVLASYDNINGGLLPHFRLK